MPITAFTMLVGVLAIAGTPFFSGWYSKDRSPSGQLPRNHALSLLFEQPARIDHRRKRLPQPIHPVIHPADMVGQITEIGIKRIINLREVNINEPVGEILHRSQYPPQAEQIAPRINSIVGKVPNVERFPVHNVVVGTFSVEVDGVPSMEQFDVIPMSARWLPRVGRSVDAGPRTERDFAEHTSRAANPLQFARPVPG